LNLPGFTGIAIAPDARRRNFTGPILMHARNWLGTLAVACCLGSPGGVAFADKIKHPTTVFAGLDKITGRIISFEVAINETVQFGSLQITPKVCFSRPTTEAPQTDVFAEVDEVNADKAYHRIFSGWMFADSPGLHGIEHPVYDIWLTDCKGDGPLIHEAPLIAEAPSDSLEDPIATAPDATVVKPPPAAPPKKRKPRPPPVAQAPDAGGPLDLSTVFNPSGRSNPTRRYYPTDVAPIPPANIGQ
jgi:hypothetical protein